jgi:hypothetical protein
MPDELYRRCPACLGATTATPCPTCGGERYVPAGVTMRDVERLAGKGHRRWRIRIGTLMLLVLIAALASFVVTTLWREAEAARRAVAQERMMAEAARAAAQQAQLAAQARAQAQAQLPAPPAPAR